MMVHIKSDIRSIPVGSMIMMMVNSCVPFYCPSIDHSSWLSHIMLLFRVVTSLDLEGRLN